MGRLAIIDYGVGGLDLYKRVKNDFAHLGVTYFSDSGAVPYGRQTKPDLAKRIKEVVFFLKKREVETVIVACHSASTVVHLLGDDTVIDLIESTRQCVESLAINKSVGIIGGGRTIYSKLYSKHLKQKGFRVFQRVAQPLSILIEKGEIGTLTVFETLEKILKPIKNVDVLLLACTHYSVLLDKIVQIMGENCQITDPIPFLYEQLQPKLPTYAKGIDEFYTTGNVQLMKEVSKRVYGLEVKEITKI